MTGLDELVRGAAEESSERVAVVVPSRGRRLSWADLDAEVDAVAHGLDAMGLVAGYRVLIALPNRVEFITAYLGALRSRLVAVPVNPRSAVRELTRMVDDCGARVVVADPSTLAAVREALAGLGGQTASPRVVAVDGPALAGETTYDALLDAAPPARAAEQPPAAALEPADPESLAVLLYTSGTSGRPRAAMLSHRAVLANLEQTSLVEPPMLTGDDVVFGVLPLFHVYGLNAVLGNVLRQRARLVLVDGFDLDESLAVIEEQGVSVVPVAPPVFGLWNQVPELGDRFRGVRLVLSGSAPLDPELVTTFTERTGLEVHEGYGLTEAAPVVTSTLCSTTHKPGSVGAALPGISVRLLDDAGGEPDGQDPGEILVKGDNLFSGYWPDGADGPDADGWYATGDVGFLDPDGDLFLVDRLKELVIVSGFNVYPVEVEEVLTEVDGVAEAAVIGAPDAETGERVVAYVSADPGSSPSRAELTERVEAHCTTRLARFKQPREVHVVDQLPHTVTGKVAKGRLRSRRTTGLLE